MRKKVDLSPLLFVVTIFLLSVPVSPTESVFADSGRIQNSSNGHSYQRIDTQQTWDSARSYCTGIGGYLATITSEAENAFVFDNLLANANGYYFIGASSISGTWAWQTGEAWGYSNWDFGEPNNSGWEKCIHVYGMLSGAYSSNHIAKSWNNTSCSYSGPFICEWDAGTCSQSDLDAAYQQGYQAGLAEGNNSNSGACATFDLFTNTLHVPCFNINTTNYWLDFGINNMNPLLFEVKDFGPAQ